MLINLFDTDKKGNEVNLWQTPTWVTNMAFYSWKIDKQIDQPKKRHWKDIRKIYLD